MPNTTSIVNALRPLPHVENVRWHELNSQFISCLDPYDSNARPSNGYFQPAITPTDGQGYHTVSDSGIDIRDWALAYAFGDNQRDSVMSLLTNSIATDRPAYNWHGLGSIVNGKPPEPVANFLASPTDAEQQADDEWLRNSPWG